MRRVALVTGASRGIGRGIALELAAAGFDIAATATALQGLSKVCGEVEALGVRCHAIEGDIATADGRTAIVRGCIDQFRRIDLLVNNAGVAPLERRDMLEATEESFDRVVGINLRGSFFLTQAVAREMVRAAQAGEYSAPPGIIFITSISADTASPNRAEYCISKAGLGMTAQCFAVRLAEHGINVYEVRPGIIATDMTAGVTEKYDQLIGAGLLLQPRWGTPRDVGRAVAALARGDFAYSTGGVFEVGGGFGVKRL